MHRLLYVFLSFDGRIKRRTWLVFFLAIIAAEYFCETFLRDVLHISGQIGNAITPASENYFDRASTLASLIFLWPSLAVDVKRWHDLGKSGWYTLIVYGPVLMIYLFQMTEAIGGLSDRAASAVLSVLALVFLVYLILLAARKGNRGANRFGSKPA